MELHQLRIFIALAEERSMTATARRLHVTQPAISFAVAQLEREIGFALFHRSNRGLTLTSRAEEILGIARAVVRGAEEIENVSRGVSETEGAVRLAGRPGFMQYVLPRIVGAMERTLPRIELKAAITGSSSEVVAALRTGQADLAFAASPEIKSIVAEVIFHDPVWIAVAHDHPLTRKRSISPRDLATLRFCAPVATDRLRSPIDKFLRQVGKTVVKIETNDYTVMKNLIVTGEYAGFIYAHMMLGSDAKDLQPLRLPQFELKRDLTVLHRRDDLPPHVARTRAVLIEEAQKVLRENELRFRTQRS